MPFPGIGFQGGSALRSRGSSRSAQWWSTSSDPSYDAARITRVRPIKSIEFARRTARGAVLASLPALASCAGVVSRSRVLSLLEAVQRPFDLHDSTWLGVPAALPAHLIVSASLGVALAWLCRPKLAGVLLGIVILAKEGVDLMIIALYQPVTWANASGSAVDILASVAGACLGLWIGTRARPRASD